MAAYNHYEGKKMSETETNFDEMLNRWPSPFVARSEVGKFSGGLIAPRTLANLDSLGEGPAERVKLGGRVGYPVRPFVKWLNNRLTSAGCEK